MQFNIIGQPWYLVSVTLSKISICFFFMDLLRRARQWRILLAGLIVLMAAINLAFALVVYLQCQPLRRAWDPSVAGSCSDPKIQVNFGYAQGGRLRLLATHQSLANGSSVFGILMGLLVPLFNVNHT